ncbi:MAG TPA: anti-sigma factor domain-containing protein [Clostridiaceae bacterium]|nr:anti-sigma factor domain-containing protein [Clostridiaceae bacterium]
MKVVIVDIDGKYAVALKKDGEFIKIKNNGKYKVGYEYDVEKRFTTAKVARIASMAAVLALIVGVGAGVYSYNMPYSYVDLEINPSVEITANIFDRIINVKGLNDAGVQLLSQNGIKNRVLQEGIDIILSSAVEQGYLKKDEENAIIITVSAKDSGKAGQLEESIGAVAAEKLQSYSVKGEILVEETTVDMKQEAAKKYGITSGKMNLINKLIEKDPELKIDDLKDKPVKDIMQSIKELKNSGEGNNQKNDGKISILNKPGKDTDKPNKDVGQVSTVTKGNSNNKNANYNNKGNNKNSKDDDNDRDKSKNNKNNKDDDDNRYNRGNNKNNKGDDDNRYNKGNNKNNKNDDDNRYNKGNNKNNKDDDNDRDNKGNNKNNKNDDDNRYNKGNSKNNKDDDNDRDNKGNNKNNKNNDNNRDNKRDNKKDTNSNNDDKNNNKGIKIRWWF